MGNVKSIAFCLILLFLGVNAGNLHGQNKSQIQPYRIERIKKTLIPQHILLEINLKY